MRLSIRLLSSVVQKRPFYITTPIFYVNAGKFSYNSELFFPISYSKYKYGLGYSCKMFSKCKIIKSFETIKYPHNNNEIQRLIFLIIEQE